MLARVAPCCLVVAIACQRTTSPAPTDPEPVGGSPHGDAATPPTRTEPTTVDPLQQPWRVDVIDGSGNAYVCLRDDAGAMTFEYEPMTPERSSSGMYSGGDPRTGSLTDAQAAALWREVTAAVDATAGRVVAHAKGTIAIRASGPTDAEVVVDGPTGAALLGVLGLFGR